MTMTVLLYANQDISILLQQGAFYLVLSRGRFILVYLSMPKARGLFCPALYPAGGVSAREYMDKVAKAQTFPPAIFNV